MSDYLCSECAHNLPGHHGWCGRSEESQGVGLKEAQEIIRILVEDKSKTVKKHIYNGERIADWWKKWGMGELELPVRKKYPK